MATYEYIDNNPIVLTSSGTFKAENLIKPKLSSLPKNIKVDITFLGDVVVLTKIKLWGFLSFHTKLEIITFPKKNENQYFLIQFSDIPSSSKQFLIKNFETEFDKYLNLFINNWNTKKLEQELRNIYP